MLLKLLLRSLIIFIYYPVCGLRQSSPSRMHTSQNLPSILLTKGSANAATEIPPSEKTDALSVQLESDLVPHNARRMQSKVRIIWNDMPRMNRFWAGHTSKQRRKYAGLGILICWKTLDACKILQTYSTWSSENCG